MTRATLEKVWTVVGSALLYLTLNAWLRTQGFPDALPGLNFKEVECYSTAIFGIALCGPLLLLECYLTARFAGTAADPAWTARTPTAFGVALLPRSRDAHVYRALFLMLFLVVPLAGQIHFLDKFRGGSLYVRGTTTTLASGLALWTTRAKAGQRMGRDFIFGDPATGVTLFPFWEPWLLLAIVVAACVAVGVVFLRVFRGQLPSARARPHRARRGRV